MDPVGKATMQEGQQISVEGILFYGAPGGCLLFYLSKGSKMSKSTFVRRDARLLPH